MELNYEVLNYLNLVGERFGKMYLKRSFNPLPDDFRLTSDVICERLDFQTMQDETTAPEFLFGDKKEILKRYKYSLHNIGKIEKYMKSNDMSFMSDEMQEKLKTYLTLRKAFLKEEILNFGKTDFYEKHSISELTAIDPVFSEIFESTYLKNVDIRAFVCTIEQEYKKEYELLKDKAREKERLRLEQMLQNMEASKKSKELSPKSKQVTKTIDEISKLEKLEKETRVRETFEESTVKTPKKAQKKNNFVYRWFKKDSAEDDTALSSGFIAKDDKEHKEL